MTGTANGRAALSAPALSAGPRRLQVVASAYRRRLSVIEPRQVRRSALRAFAALALLAASHDALLAQRATSAASPASAALSVVMMSTRPPSTVSTYE